MKYIFWAILLFHLASSQAFAASCSTALISDQQRLQVEQLLSKHIGGELKRLQDLETAHELPVEALRKYQEEDTIFMTLSYDIPILLKIPAKEHSVYQKLNVPERKYLVEIVEDIFRQNTYSRSFDTTEANRSFANSIKVYSEDLDRIYNQGMQKEYNTTNKSLFTLKALWKILTGGFYEKEILAREFLFQKISPVELRQAQMIDLKSILALAYMKKNCVGVCRHSAEIMALTLLELGYPAKDLKIKFGFSAIPTSGHAWISVNGQSYDPTPGRSSKAPTSFYKFLYPLGGKGSLTEKGYKLK